ncbi:MAG: Fe-S cluster assembly protein SufD [bacterium]
MTDRALIHAPVGLSREAVEAISERLREPAWLRERRLEAWRLYEAMPLPDTKAEAWRRTDISGLNLAEIVPSANGAAPTQDGQAPDGVVFMDLAEAVGEAPDLLREHLHSLVRPDELKFRALAAALWTHGTFLYVPPRVEVAIPLGSATRLDRPGTGLFPHTLVIADEGSKVTLVERFASRPMDRRTLVSGAAEIIVRDGAQVRYVAVQEWGANVWDFGVVRARLGRDANLASLIVAFGGSLTKTDIESQLAGAGASSEMLGLYFGEGTQHFDFHTLQEHLAPHTMSDLLYKGAVKDRARSVFSGLIRVHPGAQKTNAFQVNRNLILNAGAKSDSIPNLEIMANDLRCTHGSATGRLNEEHLFYLMSRGLTRRQAIQMVVDGFFAEVLDRVPLPDLADRMRQEIASKIAESDGAAAGSQA